MTSWNKPPRKAKYTNDSNLKKVYSNNYNTTKKDLLRVAKGLF